MNDSVAWPDVEVVMDSEASTDEVAAVQGAFQSLGVVASVSATYERKGIGDIPWTFMVITPVTVFLAAFAKEVGTTAGKDTYAGLKTLVHSVWTSRSQAQGKDGVTILRDRDSGRYLILEHDLEDRAYEELPNANLARSQSSALKFDRGAERWDG